jgi:hypothetical protein
MAFAAALHRCFSGTLSSNNLAYLLESKYKTEESQEKGRPSTDDAVRIQ